MKLTRRERIDASTEAVYGLLTDASFQEAKCAATSEGGSFSVDVGGGTPGHTVHTQRELPSDGLPDSARSFVGNTLTVVEDYTWGAPEQDGARQAVVDVHVKGAPLTLKGTLRLEPDGAGSVQVLDADLKANVPFIGGTIEKAAAGPFTKAVDTEIAMIRERLGG